MTLEVLGVPVISEKKLRKELPGLDSRVPYAAALTYVKSKIYSVDIIFHMWYINREGRMYTVIEIRIDELLGKHERSFYWLAKETGISHTTLWRLKKGKALGINFETLEKICSALACQPGDVLRINNNDGLRERKRVSRGR